MFETNASRRAVLAGAGGIAAAGAVATVPVVAAASGVHRSTPIQRLWAQYQPTAAEAARLSTEASASWERRKALAPAVPDELHLSHLDVLNFFDDDLLPGLGLRKFKRSYSRVVPESSLQHSSPPGLWTIGPSTTLEWMTAEGWRRVTGYQIAPDDDWKGFADFRERAHRVLPIAERHEATCDAVYISSGYAAAAAASEAADSHREALQEMIFSTPAETIADLVVLAEIAKATDDLEGLAASILSLGRRTLAQDGGANV